MSKSVTIKKSVGDTKDVQTAFQEALGLNGADPVIVLPKINNIELIFQDLYTLFLDIAKQPYCDSYSADAITVWVDTHPLKIDPAIKILQDRFSESLETPTVTKAERVDFNTAYTALKESEIVSTMMNICKNLNPYKKSLDNDKVFSTSFIDGISGLEFNPLVFTSLNFKMVVDKHRHNRDVILNTLKSLHHIYAHTYALYKIIVSSDIDVAAFASIVTKSIGDLRKHIPRCDLAFDKILGSIGMLEGNFDGYYKEFIITKNPMSIMENFITDVADHQVSDTTNKNRVKLVSQFREIVKFYRQKSQGKVKDPKIKALFSKLEESFGKLDEFKMDTSEESKDDESTIHRVVREPVDKGINLNKDDRDLDDLVKFIDG